MYLVSSNLQLMSIKSSHTDLPHFTTRMISLNEEERPYCHVERLKHVVIEGKL